MGKLAGVVLGGVRKAFQPRWLLVTNTTVCCGLLGLGDSLQQLLANSEPFDRERNGRVMTTALLLGPMNHFWYKWLDRCLVGKSLGIVAAKVALDLASCPAFSSTFVVGVALQEGRELGEALEEYRQKCLSIFALDLCVWPLTQTVNFYFLPASVRVLYTSGVQVLYNAGISSIKHDSYSGAGRTADTPRPKPRSRSLSPTPGISISAAAKSPKDPAS